MVAVLADDALEALALAGLLVAGTTHGELGVAAAALAAFGEDYKALTKWDTCLLEAQRSSNKFLLVYTL